MTNLFTPDVPFLIFTFPANLGKERASLLLVVKRVLLVEFLCDLAWTWTSVLVSG